MSTTTKLGEDRQRRKRPRDGKWKMPWSTFVIALIFLIGALTVSYPTVASWFSQYNQSKIIGSMSSEVSGEGVSALHEEILKAHEYNKALVGGAELSPSSNVPMGNGRSGSELDYNNLLKVRGDGLMGRLKIPAIKVDLPIYHGTAASTLEKGVGHLEGTSLPVGGESQHSVLTAHRGLPDATLFNDLPKLKIGDRFTVEVFGEVLTYEVKETQTVLPDESKALIPVYGKDLVTLVTCTPLGINTHRMLVTAERVTPTPIEDIEAAGKIPDIPGHPWWAWGLAAAVIGSGTWVYLAGRPRKNGAA
ncbi:hypothetical protein AUR04nite_13120 [Glutamicibacter uratoxydans]|uniref:Class C sortase n=1 Tax=Glutamicibacter uratoxydans TaxID=43667 RepID=A0A4Y4DQH4_GLUUR|nr:class C sortase [Glutamicibacter uratoxydans]GED05780.1 hypothetical protein AUR04nite_13120 [Glutamicibacter uratoxydans]